MSYVRKDTLTAPPEWWKHLRPFLKRKTARAERRAGKFQVEAELNEPADDSPKGLGLHNDPDEMEWIKKNEGEKNIPFGLYCYNENGHCPYWDMAENRDKQVNGFCWFIGKGDWDEGVGELWDQVKACSIHEEFVPDGTICVTDTKEV